MKVSQQPGFTKLGSLRKVMKTKMVLKPWPENIDKNF